MPLFNPIPVTSQWTAFTMTINGSGGNPTKATTPSTDQGYWRRVADSIEIQYNYNTSSITGAAAGTGNYLFVLPNSLVADVSKLPVSTTGVVSQCGTGLSSLAATAWQQLVAVLYNSTSIALTSGGPGAAQYIGASNYAINNALLVSYTFKATVPIVGYV